MVNMSRRSVLAGSLGLAAAGALARPYIANAQAKTAVCWLNQGFIPQEDAAMQEGRRGLHEGERQQARLQHHAVHGAEPEDDLRADQRRRPGPGLHGRAVDRSCRRTPGTTNWWTSPTSWRRTSRSSRRPPSSARPSTTRHQEAQLLPVPDQAGRHAVPHLGRPGRKGRAQDVGHSRRTGTASGITSSRRRQPLRAKGMRKIYACGLQVTTVGPNDGNNLFTHFLIANGGEGIVTPDGKLHTDDPKVREAAIKSVEFMTDSTRKAWCRRRR